MIPPIVQAASSKNKQVAVMIPAWLADFNIQLKEVVMKKLQELSAFEYNEADAATLSTNRERRPPTKIKHKDADGDEYDAVYDGEWIKGTQIREGIATLVIPSLDYIFHGWFKNN